MPSKDKLSEIVAWCGSHIDDGGATKFRIRKDKE